MKRKMVRLLALIGAFGVAFAVNPFKAAQAEGISIPDESLKNAIIETLELSTDVITENDMKRLTVLETPENDPAKMIKNLTGLEYAVNLVSLDLDYNKITDLSPLSGLTKLETLDISYNDGAVSGVDGVTDISMLSSLTSLKRFSSLSNAGVSDYSVVANFKELNYLNLSLCGLEDISFVRGLSKLEKGYFAFNQISDVLPLKDLTSLKTLAIGNNKIADISPLKNLTGLTQFTVENNYIDDFTAVFGMKSLTYLDVSRNFVSDEQIGTLMNEITAEKLIVSPAADETKKEGVFALSETQKNLKIGETYRLSVKEGELTDAKYIVSDSAVATVSENGEVKAIGEGECIVGVKKNGYVRYLALTVVAGENTGSENAGGEKKNCKGCNGALSIFPAVVTAIGAGIVLTKKKRK
ncbi:MAG: leucine-rich repeat domain-containing protein [Clostridia bacterium]|nr:leucine-rich repeat domain-containing protein [Clostridia bacterium]